MYLKRTAYKRLLEWKSQKGHSALEVSGARQVGKTYLVNKFADEQYAHKIYINLLDISGELFLEQYHTLWEDLKAGKRYQNPVQELIKRFDPDFTDSTDTIVIVDEIQESAEIYNRIREFTRTLKSDFIVTGSYLGRIINPDFKYSSGDLESLEIRTLDFTEFTEAVGAGDIYNSINLFGKSSDDSYTKLKSLYEVYCKIGGYPSVVLKYLECRSLQECHGELVKIIRLFANESRRYFEDILDLATYENLFTSVARVFAKEKRGFQEDSFSEELQRIVVKDYSSNISKATVNRAIDWLYSAGIIGFAGKLPECNILDFKAKSRCYFMDIGLTSYFLKKAGCEDAMINGIVNENFVYLDLKRRLDFPAEIVLETPAFATLGNGEVDFYVKTAEFGKTYAIEVKTGKNSGKTLMEILSKGKADFALYLKGDTHGGKDDNTITVPIYGISKFQF